jgi:hypothetical protein
LSIHLTGTVTRPGACYINRSVDLSLAKIRAV